MGGVIESFVGGAVITVNFQPWNTCQLFDEMLHLLVKL